MIALESLLWAILLLFLVLLYGVLPVAFGVVAASDWPPVRRLAGVVGIVVVMMAATYFHQSYTCVNDPAGHGISVLECYQWAPTHAPYVHEQTMTVGALTLLTVGVVFLMQRLAQVKKQLEDAERRHNARRG